jgi:hypothetical protein
LDQRVDRLGLEVGQVGGREPPRLHDFGRPRLRCRRRGGVRVDGTTAEDDVHAAEPRLDDHLRIVLDDHVHPDLLARLAADGVGRRLAPFEEPAGEPPRLPVRIADEQERTVRSLDDADRSHVERRRAPADDELPDHER